MSIEQENNDMLRSQIKEVAHHSKEIKEVVNKRTRVEPWVVAKMERASSDLSDVTHYLDGERYAEGGGVEDLIEQVKKDAQKMSSVNNTKTYVFDYKNDRNTGKKTRLTERITWGYDDDLDYMVKNGFDKYIKIIATYENGKEMMAHGGSMYAGGGGLYDYKIGDYAWIRKADYNEYYGEIIDIRNLEMNLDLGKGVKGTQNEIYATIIDENDKEQSGELLPKNYAQGGSMYASGGSMYATGSEIKSENKALKEKLKEKLQLARMAVKKYESTIYKDILKQAEKAAKTGILPGNYKEPWHVQGGERQENGFQIFNGSKAIDLAKTVGEIVKKYKKYKVAESSIPAMSGYGNLKSTVGGNIDSHINFNNGKNNYLICVTVGSGIDSSVKDQILSELYPIFFMFDEYNGSNGGIMVNYDSGTNYYTLGLKCSFSEFSQSFADSLRQIMKKAESDSMYAGGGEVSFTEYKGESIMFEPHFNEYYVGDAGPFSTMDEAKAYIDGGSQMPESIRGAYERGLFSNGGAVRKMGEGDAVLYKGETWYISEKDGVMGIKFLGGGSWGSSYPFISLDKLDMSKVTDMNGNKIEIENSGSMYADGGEIKVGDQFVNTERGEKFYIEKVDTSDKSFPFYVLKSKPTDFPEVIGKNEFERYYKAGLYEKMVHGGSMYASGGEIDKTGSIDEPDGMMYEFKVNQIAPQFYHTLVGHIDKYDANEYYATYENDLYEDDLQEKTFSTFEEAEKWVLSKINLEKNRYITEYGNKMATGGGVSSENAEKIAKLEKVLTSTLVPDAVKEKARLEIERLKSETSEPASGLSAEQRDLNKKALALIDKNKINDFDALVTEALTDANYHSESFKFARLVDSSIKTKEDWYQAERFSGDDKTRDTGIAIANMCGWDGDKITETLYFVLKMKGEHKLADALKKAMEVEEASYPNRIESTTETQNFFIKEIATRTATDQRAVTEFVKNNGLTESQTLNIVQGLGMGKLKPMDFVTALVGNPGNGYEQQVIAFAKSNEAFKTPEQKPKDKVKLKDIEILWAEGNQSNYDKFPKKYSSWKAANDAVRPIASDAAKYEGYNKVKFVVTFEDGETYEGRLDVASKVDNPNIEPYVGNVFGVHIKEWLDYLLSDESGQSEAEKQEVREWLAKYDLVGESEQKTAEPIKTEEPKEEPKEQPKVSDDRLKGKQISEVSKYVPHRNIESITFTIDGKSYTVKGSDIFDGVYVENSAIGIKAKRTTKAKQPKVARTQFEEEEFEFGSGGYTRPSGKVSGIYEFAVKGGITELKVVGFERQNDTQDSLYFDDSEKAAKTKFGSILVKNNAMSKITKGNTVMATSTTGIKGKLTRIKDLF
jgi:hypothetical protein